MAALMEVQTLRRRIGAEEHETVSGAEPLRDGAARSIVVLSAHRQDVTDAGARFGTLAAKIPVRRVPEAASKVFFLRTFGVDPSTAASLDAGILDPIGKPLEVYEVCFSTIKEAVERVVKHVVTQCESR